MQVYTAILVISITAETESHFTETIGHQTELLTMATYMATQTRSAKCVNNRSMVVHVPSQDVYARIKLGFFLLHIYGSSGFRVKYVLINRINIVFLATSTGLEPINFTNLYHHSDPPLLFLIWQHQAPLPMPELRIQS